MPDKARLSETELDDWKAVRERGFAWYIGKAIAISLVGAVGLALTVFLIRWCRGATEPMNWELATNMFFAIPFVGFCLGVVSWKQMEVSYRKQRPETKPNRYMTE